MFADSALPASLTALHLAMAFVRRHRAAPARLSSPFVLPSFLFAASPWLWHSPVSLTAAVLAHLGWFAICEWLAPPATSALPPARAAATAAPRRPTPRAAAGATGPPRPSAGSAPAFITTPVLAVLEEANDIKTFRMARPEGFAFTAGQFLTVRVSIDGRPHVRCYSISSSPEAQGYLEISVRRQGLVSSTLHAAVRGGSMMTIGRPAGQFVYPAGDDRPLALLAGGIGITPLLSMLRHAALADPTRPIALLYAARRVEDAAFVHELSLIAERHPQVRIGLTFSGGSAPPPWRTGHIDAVMVRQYVPHPAHTVFCLCGPEPMMEAMDRLLRAEGVPPDQIRSERFDTAVAAALVNAPAAAQAQPIADGSRRDGVWQITFAASRRLASADTAHTLLEIAESEGVAIASSCRSGVCLTCRTRLVEGDADCRSSVLDPDDRATGFILPCVTWATSDCVLEA